MKILLLESFYASSHKQWVDGLIRNSKHEFRLLSLPGRHWKWRMHHAGAYFAAEIGQFAEAYEIIVCSDLMNVAEFRGMLAALGSSSSWYNNVPILTYFHENQITYPWSAQDQDVRLNRDNHYGWINYVSCLSSDFILFNSDFHRSNFIGSLPAFLRQFPDYNQGIDVHDLHEKAKTLPIGLDLRQLVEGERKTHTHPIILWNHRWEYDKNPEQFFESMFALDREGFEFQLIIAGESYKKHPRIFDVARERLAQKIIHFGFAKDKEHYHDLLLQSTLAPVTSNQDFFGISAIEAIAAGCIPLLPNRLAFVEHLEHPAHDNFYFDTSEDLYEKLKTAIAAPYCSTPDLRHYILKYDWTNVAPLYDAFFDSLVSKQRTT